MNTMQHFKLDYTKEELDFQGEEDEKIMNLRRQILQKEENRKNSERNILLKTVKKVWFKYINQFQPLFESEKSKEKKENFKTRRQYNHFKGANHELIINNKIKEFNLAK